MPRTIRESSGIEHKIKHKKWLKMYLGSLHPITWLSRYGFSPKSSKENPVNWCSLSFHQNDPLNHPLQCPFSFLLASKNPLWWNGKSNFLSSFFPISLVLCSLLFSSSEKQSLKFPYFFLSLKTISESLIFLLYLFLYLLVFFLSLKNNLPILYFFYTLHLFVKAFYSK